MMGFRAPVHSAAVRFLFGARGIKQYAIRLLSILLLWQLVAAHFILDSTLFRPSAFRLGLMRLVLRVELSKIGSVSFRSNVGFAGKSQLRAPCI
jgi:hypothetical protein